MSVNPTMPKEMNHSTCELRFLEIEADLKNHKKLSTTENLSKQLNEMKTQLVKIFFILKLFYLLLNKNLKGIGRKKCIEYNVL